LNLKAENNEKSEEKNKYPESLEHTPFNIMKKRIERSGQRSSGQKTTQSKRKRQGEHSSGSRKHLKEMLKIAQGKEKREKQLGVVS
jgi:hypothetical protein